MSLLNEKGLKPFKIFIYYHGYRAVNLFPGRRRVFILTRDKKLQRNAVRQRTEKEHPKINEEQPKS